MKRIEYKLLKIHLVKHHLGIIEFEPIDSNKTLVTYTIELQAHLFSKLILVQLKPIKLGFQKISKISCFKLSGQQWQFKLLPLMA